jgi:hypothetical protein
VPDIKRSTVETLDRIVSDCVAVGEPVPVDAVAEVKRLRLWRATNVARSIGLAQAIAECRDDARMDGIREGAAEIVALLNAR